MENDKIVLDIGDLTKINAWIEDIYDLEKILSKREYLINALAAFVERFVKCETEVKNKLEETERREFLLMLAAVLTLIIGAALLLLTGSIVLSIIPFSVSFAIFIAMINVSVSRIQLQDEFYNQKKMLEKCQKGSENEEKK